MEMRERVSLDSRQSQIAGLPTQMMRGGESSQRLRKNVLVSKINQKLVILPIIGIIQRFQHTIFISFPREKTFYWLPKFC